MSELSQIPDVEARADAAVAEVERAYFKGLVSIGVADNWSVLFLATGPVGYNAWLAAMAVRDNSVQAGIAKNMADLSGNINRWKGTLRVWARQGYRSDGTSYSWQQWFAFGRDLASAIAVYTGAAWDASLLSLPGFAVDNTGATVAGWWDNFKTTITPDPSKWPWWAQLGAVAAIALALGYGAKHLNQLFGRSR